jgi:Zn-dependent M28 family amino/carboxypeptidase
MAITVGAAKLINDLPVHPKRTIRVVLFGAEEMNYASAAYLAAHKEELGKIVLAAESDSGSDSVWSVGLPVGGIDSATFKPLPGLLAPLKVDIAKDPAKFSGEDVAGLNMAGVPALDVENDVSRYFDWHHSADDTLDKIDPAQLNQNVATWAVLLDLAADSDADFRTAK